MRQIIWYKRINPIEVSPYTNEALVKVESEILSDFNAQYFPRVNVGDSVVITQSMYTKNMKKYLDEPLYTKITEVSYYILNERRIQLEPIRIIEVKPDETYYTDSQNIPQWTSKQIDAIKFSTLFDVELLNEDSIPTLFFKEKKAEFTFVVKPV